MTKQGYFRKLSNAIQRKGLKDTAIGSYPWTHLSGPGNQFWKQWMPGYEP